MVRPLALSDDGLRILIDLMRPLSPKARVVFLEKIADELRGRHDVGVGELHRLARQIWRAKSAPLPSKSLKDFARYCANATAPSCHATPRPISVKQKGRSRA